jgi:hypothetical protein
VPLCNAGSVAAGSAEPRGDLYGVSCRATGARFDSEESLRTGAETFAAMDPSETPGSRVSVDTGELKVEREI